jgi:hypothetical protein
MNPRHRVIKALLLSMLVGMLASSAALAKSGFGSNPASDTITLHDATGASDQCDSDDQGSSEDPESEDQSQAPDDQGQESEDQDQESGDQEEESQEQESDACEPTEDQDSSDSTSDPAGPGNREADCLEAAGMTEASTGGTESGAESDESTETGLDHAIATVLANCIKNPQAPGLLNALRHLAANQARQEAHDAEKEARRAAREAAKAEREASKGSHGSGAGD